MEKIPPGISPGEQCINMLFSPRLDWRRACAVASVLTSFSNSARSCGPLSNMSDSMDLGPYLKGACQSIPAPRRHWRSQRQQTAATLVEMLDPLRGPEDSQGALRNGYLSFKF